MSQNAGDFTPVVKGGYSSDDPLHRRNWRHLSDFLRTNFVTRDRLADGSVTEAKIDLLAVKDANIDTLSVGKLTAGQLSAEMVVSGSIVAQGSDAEPGSVTMDAQGLRVNDGTRDVVNLPVSGEASFEGGITATSLTSEASSLQGETVIDEGGRVLFSTGLGNPSLAPSLSWVYDEYDMTLGAGQYRGIDYDATSSQLLACSPQNYRIYGFPVAGGDYDWTERLSLVIGGGGPKPPTFVDLKPFGITRLGGFIYVVSTEVGASNIVIQKWSLSGGAPSTVSIEWIGVEGVAPFTSFDYLCGMTNDGTDVYIGYVNTSGDVKLLRWNTSLVYQDSKTLESAFGTTNRKVYDIQYENISTAYWWIVWGNTTAGNHAVRAYNNAGSPARVSAQDFGLPNDSRGIAHDGSFFHTSTYDSAYWRKHTEWTSANAYVHAKISWYDNTNTYETKAGTQNYRDFTQRAKLKVTWGAIPSPADRARVYLLENGVTTSPATGAMKLQGTFTGTTTQLSTYNSGGAADDDGTSNPFPDGTSSMLVLPRGNGSYLGTGPEEGEVYYDTTDNALYAHNGSVWTPVQSYVGGRLYRNAAQNHTNSGAWELVQLDAQSYNGNPGSVDTSTNGLLVPTGFGGVWSIRAHIEFASNNTNRRELRLRLNETYTGKAPDGVGSNLSVHAHAAHAQVQGLFVEYTGPLSAADTVTMDAWQDSGGALAYDVGSPLVWFEAEYKGPLTT